MSEHAIAEELFLGETFHVPNNVIPEIQNTEGFPSIDTVSLIRHLLQDILHDHDKVILEKAENIFEASEPESTSKDFAEKIKSTYKTYDSLMLDIQRVEARIMKTHADQLIKDDALSNNISLRERMRLKRDQIFMQLRTADIKKYALLQAGDLMPEANERAMDFRLADTKTLNFLSSSSSLLQISKPLKKCASLFSKIVTAVPKRKIKEKYLGGQEILVADPDCVLFLNCKKETYEQTVKLRNVSSKIARFNLGHFPKGSNFLVCWTPLPGARKFISPGMAVSLTVRYRADPYQELKTEFKIIVCDGNPVNIKIKVHRIPPILNFSLYLSTANYTEREVMRKCSIECGTCFLGNCVTATIPLHNIGGNGRFWICGEEGWSFAEINNLTLNNILPLLPFTISPFYFSVQTDEKIELFLTFSPTEFGAAIEELYILCDNCTVRTVELFGDGIIYTKKVVEFVDMEKTFTIDRDDDEGCESWLDLGATANNGLVFKCFSVRNRTSAKLNYRWDKRDVWYNMLVKEDLFQLPMESYEILPSSGEILPKDTVIFQVKCQMVAAHSGKYRHALNFVVLDIPVEAITEDSGPVVYDNTDKEGLVDLIPGQVEIWLSVVDISATLAPTFISITGDKLRIGKKPIKREITVTNKSIMKINVAFEIPLSDPEIVKIKIYPDNFVLDVQSSYSSTITIEPMKPHNFKEKIICKINEGDLVLDAIIIGDVWHSEVLSDVKELEFGVIRRGSVAFREFRLTSNSASPVLWSIKEFAYDINDRQLYMKDGQASEEFGWLLHKGNRQPINYYLDTENPGVFCYLLEVSTFFEDKSMPSDYVLVTATVVTPKLAIRAPIDKTAIFTICDKLYIGMTRQFTFTLMNLTKATSFFQWDTPTGSDVRKLDVAIVPYSGHMAGASEQSIKISIRPLETGNVTEFYVPCFVEKEPQPAILSIICKADCLNVTFHMPKNPWQDCFTPMDLLNCEPISWGVRGRDINYPWIAKPPKPDSESEMIIPFPSVILEELESTSFDGEYKTVKELMMEPSVQEEVEDEQSLPVAGDVEIKEEILDVDVILAPQENVIENVVVEEEAPKIVHPCICHGDLDNLDRPQDLPVDVEPPCIEPEKAEGRMEKIIELVPRDVIFSVAPRVLQVLDIDEVPVPVPIPPSDESTLAFPRTPRDSILDWLESRAVIEIDIPVCTHTSRMFVVRNESPLKSEMQVNVSNFKGLEYEEESDPISEIAARLAGIKPDKWSARVDREKGLAIIVKPAYQKVPPFGVVPITVWVYADTWGCYSETICCDVKGLPVFEIQVIVRVTGSPIVFPAYPKDTDPIMRFGTVLFGSGEIRRRLRAKNTSSVDVRIAWQVFLTDINNKKVEENKPFAVKLNAWLLKESSVNSLEIIRKDSNELEPLIELIPRYGQPESKLFQMVPSEVVIPAKTEISFTVAQDTSYRVNKEPSIEHLRAVAIGFVHLHHKDQAQGDFFYRPQGIETRNLVVHFETTTDIPCLKMHCVDEDLYFRMSAIKLLSLAPDETITISKMILLKNDRDIAINTQLQAEDPFVVTKLKTVGVTSFNGVTVEPGNALEVYVDCRLSESTALGTQELMKASDDSSNTTHKLYELSYIHDRDLTISQLGFPDQVLTLHLEITFPLLRLSSCKLDFGPVVYHETKRISFEIENMGVEPIRYWVSIKDEHPCFVLDKAEGVLPSWPQPAIYIGESIGIRFTPEEIGDYNTVVLVKTLVPDCSQEIHVFGHGTFNQKFCLRGF